MFGPLVPLVLVLVATSSLSQAQLQPCVTVPSITCSDSPVNLAIPPQGFVIVSSTVIGAIITFGDAFCLPKSSMVTPSQLACSDLGTRLIAVAASNREGTVIEGCFVNVSDFISPVARCKPASVVLSSAGTATISTTDVDNGSTDQCLIVAKAVVPAVLNCDSALASPVPVTLSVVDESGNEGTCNTNVVVRDVTAPLIACRQDFTVSEPTNFSRNSLIISASDACGVTVGFFPPFIDCLSSAPVIVGVTAIDPSGNTATCSVRVTCITTTSTTATTTTEATTSTTTAIPSTSTGTTTFASTSSSAAPTTTAASTTRESTSTTAASTTTTSAAPTSTTMPSTSSSSSPTTAPADEPCKECATATITATDTALRILNNGLVISWAELKAEIVGGSAMFEGVDDVRCNYDKTRIRCRLPVIGTGESYSIPYVLRNAPPALQTTLLVQLGACEDRIRF